MLRIIIIAGGFFGAMLGIECGQRTFGFLGGIAGAALGGFAGIIAGSVPSALALSWLVGEHRRKTTDELCETLRRGGGPTPNLVLLELQRRVQDVRPHLPVVLGLLASADVVERSRGLAALRSAFPELAERLGVYPVSGPVEICRAAVDHLAERA